MVIGCTLQEVYVLSFGNGCKSVVKFALDYMNAALYW